MTDLNYQKIVSGKTCGRYIGQDDKGDVADEHQTFSMEIHNARELEEKPSLESMGF